MGEPRAASEVCQLPQGILNLEEAFTDDRASRGDCVNRCTDIAYQPGRTVVMAAELVRDRSKAPAAQLFETVWRDLYDICVGPSSGMRASLAPLAVANATVEEGATAITLEGAATCVTAGYLPEQFLVHTQNEVRCSKLFRAPANGRGSSLSRRATMAAMRS